MIRIGTCAAIRGKNFNHGDDSYCVAFEDSYGIFRHSPNEESKDRRMLSSPHEWYLNFLLPEGDLKSNLDLRCV